MPRKTPVTPFPAREVPLTFLITASIALSGSIFAVSFIFHVLGYPIGRGTTYLSLALISLFFLWLRMLNRKGKYAIAALLLITAYLLFAFSLVMSSGLNVPQGMLLFALLICIINILLPSRTGVRYALIVIAVYAISATLELTGVTHPDITWRMVGPHIPDAITYIITFGIIVVVAWLFNREIEEAIKKVQDSEAALKKERDQLELRVEERTEQLRQAQFERVLELHRFADIGRHAGGLFHDLVSPLTSLSLNIEQLYEHSQDKRKRKLQDISKMAQSALVATQRLEQFVTSARKQIAHQDVKEVFSAENEIRQVVVALAYRARIHNIRIQTDLNELTLYGNPVRFYKVIQNLVANAIDSYESVSRAERRDIRIAIARKKKELIVTVQDFGCGIPKKKLKNIFQPFYTTKSAEHGTGIGLSIVCDIIENDFQGTISVQSKEGEGTCFSVILPSALLLDEK